MSWKIVGHPKTQAVTTALARKFAEMEPAPHDRPLSEIRLRVYEKIIREGGFRPCQWAMAYCEATGGTYRVNGKHTSTLMSGLDLNTVPKLYAVVEVYECDSLEDVARLYSTYDSKMQSRTAGDINHSFAACVPELNGVDSRTINLCVSAFWYARVQEAYKHMQSQERAEMLLEHFDYVKWVHELLGNAGNNHRNGHIKRMPVFAAMYSTFVRDPRKAQAFWESVRDETGATPSEPTRKLARFLVLNSSMNRRESAARHRVKDREFFVKSIHAWNAWRAGETTNLNYHVGADVPAAK